MCKSRLSEANRRSAFVSEFDTKLLPLLRDNETTLGETQLSDKARQDYAQQILKACRAKGKDVQHNSPGKRERALASSAGTWLPTLQGAVVHTRRDVISGPDWLDAIQSAMCAACIDWVPGSHSAKITSKHILRLVGSVKSGSQWATMSSDVNSLKRRAAEAELRMTAGVKKPRRRVIDFGCDVPFTSMPPLLLRGFAGLFDDPQRTNAAVNSHYQLAQNCLLNHLSTGDIRIQLMLMQVLTLASSTETPQVPLGPVEEQSFAPATTKRDAGKYAASLATRMLWFLDRAAFPWKEEERGICSVSGMVKEMGKREARGTDARID